MIVVVVKVSNVKNLAMKVTVKMIVVYLNVVIIVAVTMIGTSAVPTINVVMNVERYVTLADP